MKKIDYKYKESRMETKKPVRRRLQLYRQEVLMALRDSAGEKWSDSGFILKVELTTFDKRFYMVCEGLRNVQCLGPQHLYGWRKLGGTGEEGE